MRVRKLKVEYKLVPQEKARENLDVLLGLFTVMYGTEAGVDLVLIQTFLLYYVNQVILMLTSIFQGQFPTKKKRFVSKKGHRQPHIHSKARVLSSRLIT